MVEKSREKEQVKKILLCQPYIGVMDYQTKDTYEEFLVKSARWCDANGYAMRTGTMGRHVIQDVREDMCEAALVLGCEYVLFVDDDMILPADTLSRLMAHMNKYDIIAPLAFQRTPPFFPVMYHMSEEDNGNGGFRVNQIKVTEWEDGKVYHPDSMGFGCCLMKTKILEKLARPWFASWTTVGEDIWFSWNAKKAGFRIGVDTSFYIGHLGDRPIIGKPQFEQFKEQGHLKYWSVDDKTLKNLLDQKK